MTATSRILTAPELAAYRSDGQYTKVRAVFIPQQIVLACKCSGSLLTNDAVTSIPIDTITEGGVASVKNGMTCYVGSGSGLDDLGMVRVKSATASNLNVARVSGITWGTNVFLTVVDDFGIWAKLPTLDLTTLEMDDDVQYTDQNSNMSPIPIMGPDAAVPYTSGSLTLDGSNSYCLDGSSISSWSWSVINGSAASGSIVASGSGFATFIFPGAGSYTLELTVASTNGVSTTGHRNVYVYNDTTFAPVDQLTLKSMSTSRDNGGWQAEIALWAGANLSSVRDRSKVILIATDYYNGSVVPTGQVAGHEETLMVGWVAEETTDYSVEYSTVNFSIRGPAYWLQKCVGPSTFLESVVGTPLAWTSIENLTMDKVVHHFMYWRSTAMEVMDIYLSDNTRIIGGMSASVGSIWSQIYDTATTRMLSYLCCDRFGRFFMFLDPQLIPVADRTGILTVQPLTTADLADKVSVKRTVTNPISLLEVAGLAQSGSTVMMYMSRAPGSLIYNRWGENNLNDRLVVDSQDDANVLSGMLLAKKNNMYDTVSFTLGQNNKMLDIAPAMYVSYTVSTSDTIRGFSFAAQRFLIKSIRYTITPETGAVTEDLECEGETVGIPGYTVEVPQEPVYDFPPDPPPLDPNDYPVIPDFIFPPLDPPIFIPPPIISGSNCPNDKPANGPFPLYFNSGWLQNDSSTSLIASAACKIRSGSAVNKTRYELYGDFQSLSFSGSSSSGSGAYTSYDSFYTVYGLSGSGVRVATGIHNAVSGSTMRSGYFSGSAAVDIKYLEIVAVPDALHPDSLYVSGSTSSYQPGSVSWGSNGNGCWFSQVGATMTGGPFNRLINIPIAFQCSGSGADGDYADDWFSVQTVLALSNKVGGVDIATKMMGVEVPASPEPAKPYWYDFYIDNGTGSSDHVTKFIFPARNNGDTTYKLYGCSGSAGYFNFQNTKIGTGGDINRRRISLMLAWSVHLASGTSVINVANWYIGIVRRASYRLRVTSANIYNTCEVG